MGVGTAVDVDHRRVLLRCVEVAGLHQAVVKVGHTVGGLDGTAFEDWLHVVFPGIIGCQKMRLPAIGRADKVDAAGHAGLGILVVELGAAYGERGVVHTLTVVEQRASASLDVDAVEVALQGMALVALDDDRLVLLVEAQHIEHHPGAAGQLSDFLARRIK